MLSHIAKQMGSLQYAYSLEFHIPKLKSIYVHLFCLLKETDKSESIEELSIMVYCGAYQCATLLGWRVTCAGNEI